MLNTLWHYRSFIRSSIRRDLHARYSRSSLGGLWALLQPLAQAAIFALVLSVVLKAKLPGIEDTGAYAAYLLSGMLCWNLFLDALNKGVGLFIEHAGLIKKIRFPLLTLPCIAAGIVLLNNLFLLAATIFIQLLLGYVPGWPVLMLPLLMAITLLLGLGLGLVLGVLNVFVRDVGVAVPIVTQFLFWFCPIVYSAATLPSIFAAVIRFNPVAGLVQAYQQVLVFGQWPHWHWLVVPAVLAVVCWIAVRWLLRRTLTQMVDIL